MDIDIYNRMWASIVKLEIDGMIHGCLKEGLVVKLLKDEKQSKDLLYSRYMAEKADFKRKAMLNPNELIDRHKIAALFYLAFIYKTDGYEFPFIVFDRYYGRQLEADIAVTHRTAFDVSLGILESFILSDPKTPQDFKSYIEANGLIEPQIICEGKIKEDYEVQTIKQLIFAQKENKLSEIQIRNIDIAAAIQMKFLNGL